jgi:hypothetical protein
MASKAPKGIDFHATRDLFVTGAQGYESIRKAAATLGVSQSTIDRVACDPKHEVNNGQTWVEQRTEFRESVGIKTRKRAADIQAAAAASVNSRHRIAIESLVHAAIPKALEALNGGEIEPRDRVKLALSAMAMQRTIHGLNRAVALEITGKDGEPIEIAVDVDPITDAAARTVLEAALGRPSHST